MENKNATINVQNEDNKCFLENKTTFPFWIAITERNQAGHLPIAVDYLAIILVNLIISWTPSNSSRLFSNHFIESGYKLEHKKGVYNQHRYHPLNTELNFQ